MKPAMEMAEALDYLLETAATEKLDLEIMGMQRTSTAISFQQRKMDQFSFSETRQLGIRFIEGKHEGVAYTESLDRDSLDSLITESRANAKMIQREWISELHSPSSLPEMNELYNPALDEVLVEQKIKAASQLESTALEFDRRITKVPHARYGDSNHQSWLANSKGLRATYKANLCYAYAYAMAQDGDNNVMAYNYEAHRDFKDLSTEKIAKVSAEKTIARIGATRPETGIYTVVFENRVAETLIGLITNYFSAKAIDDKSSPLIGKLGQKIFSPNLTITDDPFHKLGHGSRPFDDEGYPSKATTLVQDGLVSSFLTNSIMAKKLKLPHTASAARSPSTDLDISASNIVVKPGTKAISELLNGDQKVILITAVMGMAGFRATSGDFSLPVEGHLYENGKLVRPLKDFLISGNILQLLSSIEAVGSDALLPIGNTICPSLLVRGLNVAGQT